MSLITDIAIHRKQRRSVIFLLALIGHAVLAYSSMTYANESTPTQDTDKQTTQSTHHIQSADAKLLGVGQNIGFVEQLIHHSAAAKQILDSDNIEAKALREQAINFLEQAKQQQNKGDHQAAVEALNKAKTTMFQAVRLSGKKTVTDKLTTDYRNRVNSTRVLLEAHQRISQEKVLGPTAKEVEQHVEEQLHKAQQAFDQDQLDKALELANTAYLSIKLSVTRLRDGDTLVRTLHFETKEDEYNYELERNNTHKILVNVVLKDKLSPNMLMLIKIPMAKAEELRQQAIQQAKEKRFEQAITTLEKSTQQIIRAIRMAGIYIPG